MAFLDHKDVLAVTRNYFSSGSKFQFDDGLFRPRGCSCGLLEVDIIRRSFLRPFSRPHFQGRCHGPKKFPLVKESPPFDIFRVRPVTFCLGFFWSFFSLYQFSVFFLSLVLPATNLLDLIQSFHLPF